MSEEDAVSRINQRRKQVLIHSVLYYKVGVSIIPDTKWDEWARELFRLQQENPEILSKCWRNDIFENFDPCSGYYLPLNDEWANRKAKWLLHMERKGKKLA